MKTDLSPPAAGGDAQRPISDAELSRDPLALATWQAYAAAVQVRVAQRRADSLMERITRPLPIVSGRPLTPEPCPFCARRRSAAPKKIMALLPEPETGVQDARGMSLRVAIRSRRLTQWTLHERSGVAYSTLNDICRGHVSPQQTTREKLAAALRYDPATIDWPQHGVQEMTESEGA